MLHCSKVTVIGVELDVDDSYKELGLTAESSDAEVKAAWRRLAARWHPDRNGSPQALKKIQRINRALAQIRGSRGETNGNSTDRKSGARADQGASADSAPPLNHTVELTLEEAVAGCTREVRGEVVDDCVQCSGSGLQPLATACEECNGAGKIRRHLWFAWAPSESDCSACAGQGVTRLACEACEGDGKQAARAYQCRVEIPRGARSGDTIHALARVQGHKKKVACAIRVEVAPHEFFEVHADGTVHCEIPVDGFAWVANRWIEVPTPTGLRQMRLQRGHLVYRIKGQGFPARGAGSHADCLVTVVPLFPQELSSEQDALIDKLISTCSKAPDTAAGKRVSAWNQAVRKWEAKGRGG